MKNTPEYVKLAVAGSSQLCRAVLLLATLTSVPVKATRLEEPILYA